MAAKSKRIITSLALTLAFMPTRAAIPREFDEIRLLAAIAQVETGTRNINRPSRRIGAAGERTAWQIKETTWKLYSTAPFKTAGTDARIDGLVALAHLRALALSLYVAGHSVAPQNLAIAWNAGAQSVIRHRIPVGTHDYADRVCAIYSESNNPAQTPEARSPGGCL